MLNTFRNIFRRKPRQRGLCGTALWAAREGAEKQAVEPYICGTMLLRMMAEQREQEIASAGDDKPQPKGKL